MSDPLELEDFYDLTLLTDLAVSPDGTRVAFVADEFDRAEDDRRSSLFVAPTDGSRDSHRLSRASDASAPAWSPDGSKLAFTAARDTDAEIEVTRSPDGDGDPEPEDTVSEEDTESKDDPRSEADGDEDAENGTENGATDEPKPQVWAFDLERGGDARQITDFEEGAKGFDWGPDGERLVVAARDPTDDQREYLKHRREEDGPVVTERLQHKFDGQGWLDDVTTYLFVVDYDTRETERLDDAYGGGAREPATGLQPAWSPGATDGVVGGGATDGPSGDSDGSRIAFLSNRTDRPDDNYVMDVYTVAPDGSDLRKLTDSDLTAGGLRWHPDGDRLAFVGGDPENWYRPSEVFVADAETAAYESWSGDLDRTVARYGRLSWDGDDLLAAIGDEGLTRLARFREDGDPERTFGAQGRDRTVEGFDARGGTAAVVLSDPQNGKDLFAADPADLDDTVSRDDTEAGTDVGTGDAEPTRLTALNDDLLAGRHAPESRRFTFESGGDEVEAIAYFPDDFDADDPSPRPLVASIHGGPISYDAPTFSLNTPT